MKRITNLDGLIPHPDADEPDESKRPTAEQVKNTGTMRRFFRILFLNLPTNNIDQADRNAQIALKLRQAGDEVDFEDAEFNAIFDEVKANKMQWPGHMHHYFIQQMRAAEKRKLDVKIEEAK
jgi:hypothetical protein